MTDKIKIKTIRHSVSTPSLRNDFDQLLREYINDGWEIFSPMVASSGDCIVMILSKQLSISELLNEQ
jgi:hypothetical protein